MGTRVTDSGGKPFSHKKGGLPASPAEKAMGVAVALGLTAALGWWSQRYRTQRLPSDHTNRSSRLAGRQTKRQQRL